MCNGEDVLPFDEFLTVTTEVEAVLNSDISATTPTPFFILYFIFYIFYIIKGILYVIFCFIDSHYCPKTTFGHKNFGHLKGVNDYKPTQLKLINNGARNTYIRYKHQKRNLKNYNLDVSDLVLVSNSRKSLYLGP